jgi:hypothetical protein
LAAELIKLVDITICVGAVAFAGAVILQTDIGALDSGNLTNKGSHSTILSRKVVRSRAKSGQEESMLMLFCVAPYTEAERWAPITAQLGRIKVRHPISRADSSALPYRS